MITNRKERGQILVILGLALVAILGVTALAVDGSLIFNERREDQSTADSASMAGASAAAQYMKVNDPSGFSCGSASTNAASVCAVIKAQSTALEDNVLLQSTLSGTCGGQAITSYSSQDKIDIVCGVSNGQTYLDIISRVSSERALTFGSIISDEPFRTNVDTTARVYAGSTFAGGNGVVSTDRGACSSNGGIYVSGTARLETIKAGIMSNNCITLEGSARAIAYAGTTQYFTGLNLGWSTLALNDTNPLAAPGSTVINEGVTPQSSQPAAVRATQATTQFPEMTIPVMVPQTCSGLPDRGGVTIPYSATPITLQPGLYTYINHTGWSFVTFSPGVYCIKPGGYVNLSARTVTAHNTIWYFQGAGYFQKTNTEGLYMDNSSVYLTNGDFRVENGANIVANNITIYIKQGNFALTGDVPAVMTAPGCSTSACGVGPSIPGVLLYMDKTNTGTVSIEGSSSLEMEGTLFAPNSRLTVSGNTGLKTLKAQLIAKRVEVTGSSGIRLDLTNATLYTQGASTIELYQ